MLIIELATISKSTIFAYPNTGKLLWDKDVRIVEGLYTISKLYIHWPYTTVLVVCITIIM